MKLIKQLDWFIKRQKRTYIVAIILLIITGVVDMLPPWIIGQAIDAIREGSLTTERLVMIVGSLLGIMVLSYVLSYVWIARLFGTAFLLEKKLRARFFGHLLRQTPRFYQQHRTGDLMALATNDLKAVEGANCGICAGTSQSDDSGVFSRACGAHVYPRRGGSIGVHN